MLKQRIIGAIVAIALIIATAGASTSVANALAGLDAPVGQAIACNTGSSSGGGC